MCPPTVPPAALPPQAPLSQTLQRAHVAFECLLDIIVLQQQLARDQPALAQRLGQPAGEAASTGKPVAADSSQAGEEEAEGVLLRIARDLLALGEFCAAAVVRVAIQAGSFTCSKVSARLV